MIGLAKTAEERAFWVIANFFYAAWHDGFDIFAGIKNPTKF